MRNYLTILRLLRSICVGACLLWTVPANAVQPYTPVHPDPVLEPWRWTTFSELNGLGLRCLTEDRDGNVWFGVDKCARRYDGKSWTDYTSADGLYGAPVLALSGARDSGPSLWEFG